MSRNKLTVLGFGQSEIVLSIDLECPRERAGFQSGWVEAWGLINDLKVEGRARDSRTLVGDRAKCNCLGLRDINHNAFRRTPIGRSTDSIVLLVHGERSLPSVCRGCSLVDIGPDLSCDFSIDDRSLIEQGVLLLSAGLVDNLDGVSVHLGDGRLGSVLELKSEE